MKGTGMMIYKNDKLFQLTKNKTSNSSVIVVTNLGEIRIGHNNYLGRSYRNASSYEPPWDYEYYDTITKELLEKIILEKDSIKGLIKHFENIPSGILTYLLDADLQELKNALEYFREITKQKKYILIHGGCNDYQDDMKIVGLKDFSEAQDIIEQEFADENYYGFFNTNLRNHGYWFSIIVTDDEKLNLKYRDALNYEEFKEVCNAKFDMETLENFELVWNYKTKKAEKNWSGEKYEDEEGQIFYTKESPQWKTFKY